MNYPPLYKKYSLYAFCCIVALFPSGYYVFKHFNEVSYSIALLIFSISWFILGFFGGLNYVRE